MKILVTASSEDLNGPVDPRFGRAAYYVIFDSENPDAVQIIPNPNAASPSGAGIAAAQYVASQGVNIVVSGSFGPNASSVLSGAGIQMVSAPSGMSVREAYEMALQGKLGAAPANPNGQMPPYPPQGGFGGPGFGGGAGFGGGFGGGFGRGRGGGFGRGRGRGGGFGKGGGRGQGGGFGGGFGRGW